MKKIILFVFFTLITFGTNAQVADTLRIRDTRNVIEKPSNFKTIAKIDFKTNAAISLGNYSGFSGLFTIAPWVNDSGGPNHQLAFYKDGIFHRIGHMGYLGNGVIDESKNKWNSWSKIIMGDINGVIQSKLDVNGIIRSKEVKIEATGWSDFVFDKDYKLPTLSEVENHIKEHKHLPDIPSEKQVIEEGINVVEMQAKLLQKIEELTLYVIEQNKQIESLHEKNNKQEKLIEELRLKLKD